MPGAVGIGRVTEMEDYWAEAIKICEKWEIDHLDLYHDSYVSDTLLQVTTNVCLRDPIHPNELGYDRFAPLIGDWMETISQ
ncbi:MAG: SGNH/GDSL hydrolase family protein [Clostridia bacterium]|nr:SGNH/GDSL hydrolase family protein [Clostridia bacterium]